MQMLFLSLKFSSFWWLGVCLFVLCPIWWCPVKWWACPLQESDLYLKICAQRKMLLSVMSNSRIKNAVAYLENRLESRKLKKSQTRVFLWFLQYGLWLQGTDLPIQCWGDLTLLTPASAACVNATHPVKPTKAEALASDLGWQNVAGRHARELCCFRLQKAFPCGAAQSCSAPGRCKALHEVSALSLRSPVPLEKLGWCGCGCGSDFGA